MDVLKVKNLHLSIGETDILKGVSFSVGRGQTVGLVGESGSGKSMTAYAVTDYLLPGGSKVTGEVIFPKVGNLRCLSPKERRKVLPRQVAMILQDSMNSLNPHRTLLEQMTETYCFFKGGTEKEALGPVKEVLALTGLPPTEELLGSYPYGLSGGMRQRVAIAMALLQEPSLIIADEPTTALDTVHQGIFIHLMKEIREKSQVSILFISHNLGLVAELCERILVMEGGKIVEEGLREDIFRHPQEEMTKKLVRTAKELGQFPKEDPYSPGEVILRAKNLSKTYPGKDRPVFQNLSLTLKEGEILGIVGSSGCGKSTLARALGGIGDLDEGKIFLDGEELLRDEEKVRRFLPLQMVFQNPYSVFDPKKTLGYSLREAMEVAGKGGSPEEGEEFLDRLLEGVKLSKDLLDRRPRELSGGQLQRLGVLRVLLLHPRVLLADEIVSSLDITVAVGLLDILKRLRDTMAFSMIFISHDLAMIRRICNRVLVMDQGEFVEEGTVEELFAHPKHPFTKKLMEAIPGRMEGGKFWE